MHESSLLRRSLVWTGILLGVSSAFVGLLSLISVLIVDHLMVSLEAGRSPSTVDTALLPKPPELSSTADVARPRHNKPLPSPKPNG